MLIFVTTRSVFDKSDQFNRKKRGKLIIAITRNAISKTVG
jgi:hypothetical protein